MSCHASDHSPSNKTAEQPSVRILLVDDNDLGREMVRSLLGVFGLKAVEASNGLEAVERVRSESFDLVLMDIQMPVMDGVEATRLIRQMDSDGVKALPIIAMTAHAFDEQRDASFSAGFSSYITKPICLDRFRNELQTWLPDLADLSSAPISKPSDQLTTLQQQLPGFDVSAGVSRVAGDLSTYVKLLKKFTIQFAAVEEKLRPYLQQHQKQEALLLVHTLKGVAGNLAANLLYRQASALEVQINQGSPPEALEPMIQELHRVMTVISLVPVSELECAKSDAAGSRSELISLLETLKPYLQSLQVQETKSLMSEIQGKLWPEEHRAALSELASLVEEYQLVRAAQVVDRILSGDRH